MPKPPLIPRRRISIRRVNTLALTALSATILDFIRNGLLDARIEISCNLSSICKNTWTVLQIVDVKMQGGFGVGDLVDGGHDARQVVEHALERPLSGAIVPRLE